MNSKNIQRNNEDICISLPKKLMSLFIMGVLNRKHDLVCLPSQGCVVVIIVVYDLNIDIIVVVNKYFQIRRFV